MFFGGPGDQPQEPFDIPIPLSPECLRVLGCLIEKQFLTPEVYPMSLNGVVTACNQKTSREPVTAYDEALVDATLAQLQHLGLAQRIVGESHRVPKFRELFGEKTGLRVSEIAALCVMMLRGPQTANEVKLRSNRMHEFGDEEDVMATLRRLMERDPQPLVVCVGRQAGQREERFMHLLGGPVDANAAAPEPREVRTPLELQLADLRQRMEQLENQFAEFRKQFE